MLHDHAALVPLDLEDPFQANRLVAGWKIDEVLGPVLLDRLHLHLHSTPPALLLLCFLEGCRFFY
jgi:hypothetical protein